MPPGEVGGPPHPPHRGELLHRLARPAPLSPAERAGSESQKPPETISASDFQGATALSQLTSAQIPKKESDSPA